MKNNVQILNRCAFTLAEVLITLGIIGIVAAITIPTVKTRMEKQNTVTQLKVAYSIVKEGAKLAQVDNGAISYWNLKLDSTVFGRTYISPYFIYVKECTQMSDGCWETDGFNGYYDLAGNKITTSVPYSLILNNGMILGVNVIGNAMMSFIVDINGRKKPNKMGRDIFSFYLFSSKYSNCGSNYGVKHGDMDIPTGKDGLYLGGADNCGPAHAFYSRDLLLSTTILRSCNKNGSNGEPPRPGVGTACAAVIGMDGWKISDDYPW